MKEGMKGRKWNNKRHRTSSLTRFLSETPVSQENLRKGDGAAQEKVFFRTLTLWGDDYGVVDVKRKAAPSPDFGRDELPGGWGRE